MGQELPLYRVLNPKGFFADDDSLYPEGTVLNWTGALNEYMEPMNEPAREKMQVYLEELEDGAKAAAAKFGRSYSGRLTDLADIMALAMQDAKAIANKRMDEPRVQVSMPRSDGDAPVMGNMKGQKRRGRPPKISNVTAAPPPPKNEPVIKILGRDNTNVGGSV